MFGSPGSLFFRFLLNTH